MMTRVALKYLEGGNRLAAIVVPVFAAVLLVFYNQVANIVGQYSIDTQVLYSYVFNIFAIEFGALLSLFALLACRPTQYLERIRNTASSQILMWNMKITLTLFAVCISFTFALGGFKLEPEKWLVLRSVIFLVWLAVSALVTTFYVRTIRLTFLALT